MFVNTCYNPMNLHFTQSRHKFCIVIVINWQIQRWHEHLLPYDL
jgi:hypothetical protein